MKLKELAIEGLGAHHNLHLGRFSDGFSIVYGENGAGKSRVREFVRGTLFDFDQNTSLPEFSTSGGRINVAQGAEEYQLSRDLQLNSQVAVRSLTNSSTTQFESVRQMSGNLNSDLYDTVFSVSFRETPANAFRLAAVLNHQLGVAVGPEAAGDESGYLNWQRESKLRHERLDALRLRVDALTRERTGYSAQIESTNSGRQAQLSAIESQLNQVLARINEIQVTNYHEQLGSVDREIAQLRLLIDNASKQVTYVAPVESQVSNHSDLYQRLDEIDNQIRRWRHVQSDIQNQRVRLRDEMMVWNELTLDSDEHPYHNARAILVALESKVDEAERNANHWGDASASRVDTTQMAKTLGRLCQSMRDDLYGLCNELAHQYKHIRHKSAAAELKQLRRCYSEMGENIQRLIQRRESVIKDLHEVDPAGADAVMRSDQKFCECAQHAGYLEARKRFVGSAGAPVVSSTQAAAPNLHAERARLATLEQQRAELAATIARVEQEHHQLNSRHADLVSQRDGLLNVSGGAELNLKIQSLTAEIQTLTNELNLLTQQIELDRNYAAAEPNALLKRAGGLLNRMSNGDLTQVFLSEPFASTQGQNNIELQVRDRYGKVLNFSGIDAGLQDQVYLSLMLSAKEQLHASGNETPTLIDDAFCRIPADRVTPTLTVMNEFSALGHQLIALTQHRYLAERIPGLPLFELVNVPVGTQFQSPTAVPTPITQTPVPVAAAVTMPSYLSSERSPETRSHEAHSHEAHSHEAYVNSSTPRPYPLSKYARTNSDYVADDRNYTVAYPFPNTGMQHGPEHLDPAHFESLQSRSNRTPQANVSAVSVDSIGDRLGYASGVTERTRLDKVGFFEPKQLRTFNASGIDTVEDLLQLDAQSNETLGFHPDQVDRWQSQLWLLINLPGIRLNDARILVACGVTEPEQLDTSHPQQIFERIERFLSTSEGQRFAGNQTSISMERINGWYRSLDATRSRWQNRRRPSSSHLNGRDRSYSDRDYTRREPRSNNYERSDNDRNRSARTYQPREREDRSDREPRVYAERPARAARPERESRQDREPRIARAPRMNTPRPDRKTAPRVAPASLVSKKKSSSSSSEKSSKSSSKLKFYLDLGDHIEAAPSIGPKTAERFEKIGVVTVTDFLKQTAESMATKINYKRMTADVIREWQHQARLVCRIPNLRGHDAQLLVACGVTEPEELSTMQPKSLFEIIGPFSDTKEGLKIIRNGKKPDLAEITDWISWAEKTRSLQAA